MCPRFLDSGAQEELKSYKSGCVVLPSSWIFYVNTVNTHFGCDLVCGMCVCVHLFVCHLIKKKNQEARRKLILETAEGSNTPPSESCAKIQRTRRRRASEFRVEAETSGRSLGASETLHPHLSVDPSGSMSAAPRVGLLLCCFFFVPGTCSSLLNFC